jgi:DNA-binding NtrC family response regulator
VNLAQDRKLRLLVIDDDPLVVDTIELCLPDHWTLIAQSKDNFNPNEFYHAAFVDIHLSGDLNKSEGLQVMKTLNQQQNLSEIVAMSGDLRRENMEATLKAGATRFMAKPLSADELKLILEKIEALWVLRGVSLKNKNEGLKWIGQSESSDQVRRFIANMRNEKAPILIEGESGVGKEVVAQLLHQSQPERPFVAVNVAAISDNLFESEFFGHVKGSFTGAVQNKVGFVEAAHGGDLFLDEIEALSPNHQAKLLRFLESGEFIKVGGTEVQRVNVRVIAATNEKLQKLVDKEKFREDLMYRLSGHRLNIPPLRERKQDIGELCQHFLRQRDVSIKKTMDPEAIEALKSYPWPGNVRQLKRVCEHLALMAPLPIVRSEDVKAALMHQGSAPAATGVASSYDLSLGLAHLMEQYESQVLSYALEQNMEVDELARLLKISRSSLYKKVKDHQLEFKR